MISMRTRIEIHCLPFDLSIGARDRSKLQITTTMTENESRPSSPSSISSSSSPESPANSEEIDDETYFAQFSSPSENDTDEDEKVSHCFNDDNNDEIFLNQHLSRQQLSTLSRLQTKNYQRSTRSKKKINARRQIKTKHAKSIETNSHQKHLYIHHRLYKQIILDPCKCHYLPSQPPAPLYTCEALRSLVSHYRQLYRSSNFVRHSKFTFDVSVDESQSNSMIYHYGDFTINEYTIPNEPAFDDDMINFLLEMQNRDLSPEDYEMLLRLDERVQRKTVNTNIFERLPTSDVNETHLDEQCSICMEKYLLGQQLKTLPCQHIFHSNCIETYLKEFSIQCPLDNLPLIE